MIRRLSFSRRMALIGLAVASVVGIATIPRANTHAKPENPAIDRKAVREKIVALHGDVELLKLEIEIEHAAILAKIKEGAEVPSAFEEMERAMNRIPAAELIKMFDGCIDDPQNLKEMGEVVVGELRKEINAVKAKEDEEGQRKAIAHVLEAAGKAEAALRQSKLSERKQGYAALARELASKRLDLEDAELQYREAR